MLGSRRWQRKPGAPRHRTPRGAADRSLYLGFATWESSPGVERAEEMMRAEEEASPSSATSTDRHHQRLTRSSAFDDPHITVLLIQPPTSNLQSASEGAR
jgi:hypothetical protein